MNTRSGVAEHGDRLAGRGQGAPGTPARGSHVPRRRRIRRSNSALERPDRENPGTRRAAQRHGRRGGAVDFAREHGLALVVRGGGHHIAGTALVDGGLTIDLSRLRGISVDPGARTATVQPGCRLSDVDRETQRARPGHAARLHLQGRRRRAHARRRTRLPHPPLRLDRRQPARGRDRHRGRRGAPRQPTTRTRTCSGASVAPAPTSAWSPRSPSGCTRSARRSSAD